MNYSEAHTDSISPKKRKCEQPPIQHNVFKRIGAVALAIAVAWCCASAQETADIAGKVIDQVANEPLTGASVIVKDADGKIKKFAQTASDGCFSLQSQQGNGFRLEVSMMGYDKYSAAIDSISFPVTVYLSPGSIQLKEVTIKAERIREQGDTITYDVSSFTRAQDGSIGDVLQRMPGIDVDSSGKISYQGTEINRFYIEGADLLGGRYGIATNGISPGDVGAVEVLENHQPLQVLSGISYSEQAAINLKLKDKAKAAWSWRGSIGGGWSSQPEGGLWDSSIFAMAAMPSFQNITALRSNNSGEDLSQYSNDLTAGQRLTNLKRYIDIDLPDVPSLGDSRTLFNRSVLASTNNLWKLRNGEMRANIDYSYHRKASLSTGITTYFLDEGNQVVLEGSSGKQHTNSIGAQFIYELNRKTAFVNNTLQTDIDWSDLRLATTGTVPNVQTADLPDYFVSNNLKVVKRFGSKHLVSFESINQWESMPQTLNVNIDSNDAYWQRLRDHAFATQEKAAYAFVVNGLTVSAEAGVRGYLRSMNSQLHDIPEELKGLTTNAINTDYWVLYASPRLEYWLQRVNIAVSLPVSYAHYSFAGAVPQRDDVFFSPSLSFNWKPNSRFSLTLHSGMSETPINLSSIHEGLVLTDYRTFKTGVKSFYTSRMQNISLNFSYKHTRLGLFANGMVLQSWNHAPYTLSQYLLGDYAIYSYSDASNDSRLFTAVANIGKTLNFMRGSCEVYGAFNRSKARMFSQETSVFPVSSAWSVGCKINGSPCSWLSLDCSFDYSSNSLSINEMSISDLSQMTGSVSLSFTPAEKWQCDVSCDYYRNEVSQDVFKEMAMVDASLSYSLNKHIGLSLSLDNIFNRKTYNYTTYSQLSSYESLRRLRGRELMISISIKK